MAAEKDKELERARNQGREAMEALPMMHGIPMSVKDLINMKGFLSTVGCAFLCQEKMTDDSALVKLYLKHGAIPIVRGNCP